MFLIVVQNHEDEVFSDTPSDEPMFDVELKDEKVEVGSMLDIDDKPVLVCQEATGDKDLASLFSLISRRCDGQLYISLAVFLKGVLEEGITLGRKMERGEIRARQREDEG